MEQFRIRRRLGEILVAAGVITKTQLEEALAHQATSPSRTRLGATIVKLGLATEEDIVRALADQLGLGRVDLTKTRPEPAALERVPRMLALRHLALPIRLENDVLTVAVIDPTNVVAKDDLRSAAGVDRVRMLITGETLLKEALREAYGTDETAMDMGDEEVSQVDDALPYEDEHPSNVSANDQPIVRLANMILLEAVHARASDVHVEPGRTNVRIRYRVDGMLREVMRVPRESANPLVSRLKIMARLDIAERRRPQDGRTAVRVGTQVVDLRVSTLPTMFGETVVLRLLRKGSSRLTLTDVGLSDDHLAQLRWALEQPQGLILITGPTGSGKTSSLYGALMEISDPVRNIVTLEDPIEYQLEGVNQTQINEKVDLTFAKGLRSLLRQDPDVVLVGEIRDEETAQLAMQASFTGHLVLSTLHTNDAPSTIVRLVDLGVEPFLIASSLRVVAGQRLVRVICEHCKEPAEPDDRVLRMLDLSLADLIGSNLSRGHGCDLCGQTGYHGRRGVFEVLPITPGIRELILAGATETNVRRLARAEGMRTLREDGIRKALAGITTLEEVLRVTPASLGPTHRCPQCSHSIGEGFVACPNCGFDLGNDLCRACGRSLDGDWNLCPYCRTPRAQAGAPPASPGRSAAVTSPTSPSSSALVIEDDSVLAPLPKVLVVDDDEHVRAVLALMLLDDYQVIEAGTGEEALALAKQYRPDVVLLDLRLPDIDGLEVTRRLRQDEATSWVPVVLVSGDAHAVEEAQGLMEGLDGLAKPLDPDTLHTHLAAARRARASR